METFAARFGFNIPTFLLASGKIIAKLGKQRKKKMARLFPPLGDLSTVCDAQDTERGLTAANGKLAKTVSS